MNDAELGEAFMAWAEARMDAIEAKIRAEREYVSALEGARRLSLPTKRQFISLMKRWEIAPAYLTPGRRRWRWGDIETELEKRELPPPRQNLKDHRMNDQSLNGESGNRTRSHLGSLAAA